MKMDVYENSDASSSIGYLSADSSCNSVSSNMIEHEHLDDDASSSSPNDNIFELSGLMSQLPIKRGLSKYYNGKSDSFKNLITVKTLEDIPKSRSKRNSVHKMRKRFNKGRCVALGLSDENQNYKQEKSYYTTPKSKISKSNNNGLRKASVLANTWNERRNNGLSSSSRGGFIHV